MNSFTFNNKGYTVSNTCSRIYQRVWAYRMIISNNANIQQHLSPSSQQLAPSALLTAAHRAAEWPNLSSQISSVSMSLNVTRKHCLFITIISGSLRMERKHRRIKTVGYVKRGRCVSISESPLALSYQSLWLAHVILLWFDLANQWATDSLPVTVQPLTGSDKSHSSFCS